MNEDEKQTDVSKVSEEKNNDSRDFPQGVSLLNVDNWNDFSEKESSAVGFVMHEQASYLNEEIYSNITIRDGWENVATSIQWVCSSEEDIPFVQVAIQIENITHSALYDFLKLHAKDEDSLYVFYEVEFIKFNELGKMKRGARELDGYEYEYKITGLSMRIYNKDAAISEENETTETTYEFTENEVGVINDIVFGKKK